MKNSLYTSIKLLFFYYFLLLNLSCHCQQLNSKTIASDSLLKDIPTYYNLKKTKYLFSKELSLLNLTSIENGFRGLQIRIWVGHGYGDKDSSQLLIIKKQKQIRGELVTYIHLDSNKIARKTTLITPRSGWKLFLDSIQKLGIYDLPDYSKYPDYYVGGDSFGVTVEFATSDKYRIYDYPDYIEHKEKIAGAAKIFMLMRFIENEFKIQMIY